jgi:hypothetical protein
MIRGDGVHTITIDGNGHTVNANDAGRAFFVESGKVTGWTEAGAAIWAGVYAGLSEGKPGLAGAVTSRAETQVIRSGHRGSSLSRCFIQSVLPNRLQNLEE